ALEEALSIPNILSYIRLCIIPIFIWRYVTATTTTDYLVAAGLMILSGLTDFLDGFVARRFHQITELGKFIDPVADKLTQAAIIVCLVFRFKGMLLLTLIFIIKEVTQGLSCLILYREGKKLDGALWYGKVSTAVFYLAMITLIAIPSLSSRVAEGLILTTMVVLIFAFIRYMIIFIRMHQQ
ncbi:MAG: CDP-alcohol phosphatidyltransferase family protein, partial [Niameybacter sp.]